MAGDLDRDQCCLSSENYDGCRCPNGCACQCLYCDCDDEYEYSSDSYEGCWCHDAAICPDEIEPLYNRPGRFEGP